MIIKCQNVAVNANDNTMKYLCKINIKKALFSSFRVKFRDQTRKTVLLHAFYHEFKARYRITLFRALSSISTSP